MKKLIPAAGLLLLAGACTSVPDGVIRPKKMEQVLYETHLAEALIDEYPARFRTAEQKQQLTAAVFRDNGITKADFDSSMVWYSAHLDQYMKIYARVTERLNAEADTALQAKLAYERSLLTPVGDSVDMWRGGRQLVIAPFLASATQSFEVKGDTNFRADDRAVWHLRLANLPKPASGYLCATFGYRTRDTAVVNTWFPQSDTTLTLELTLPLLNDAAGRLFGALTLLGTDTTAMALHPVFVDQVSLMRYHKPAEPAAADSLASDSLAADSLAADSLRVDSLAAKPSAVDTAKRDSAKPAERKVKPHPATTAVPRPIESDEHELERATVK